MELIKTILVNYNSKKGLGKSTSFRENFFDSMLNTKNIEILKSIQLNDWIISHVYKNYTNEIGKAFYVFQLDRTGGIASTTISLEKEAKNAMWNIQTMVRKGMYELKGPEKTIHLTLEDIKSLGAFLNKLKQVC
jgi:hypothetical protein